MSQIIKTPEPDKETIERIKAVNMSNTKKEKIASFLGESFICDNNRDYSYKFRHTKGINKLIKKYNKLMRRYIKPFLYFTFPDGKYKEKPDEENWYHDQFEFTTLIVYIYFAFFNDVIYKINGEKSLKFFDIVYNWCKEQEVLKNILIKYCVEYHIMNRNIKTISYIVGLLKKDYNIDFEEMVKNKKSRCYLRVFPDGYET